MRFLKLSETASDVLQYKALTTQLLETPTDEEMIGVMHDWFEDRGYDTFRQDIQKLREAIPRTFTTKSPCKELHAFETTLFGNWPASIGAVSNSQLWKLFGQLARQYLFLAMQQHKFPTHLGYLVQAILANGPSKMFARDNSVQVRRIWTSPRSPYSDLQARRIEANQLYEIFMCWKEFIFSLK